MRIKILMIALMVSVVANAQDWTSGKYQYDEQYPGYVITKEGEKIEGFIKYRNRYVMQEEVVFYGKKGNNSTKETYEAGDLLEYKVADKLYHCIPFSNSASMQIRANLVMDDSGCIKKYVWYDRASGYNTLQRREGESDQDLLDRKFPPTIAYFKTGDDIPVTEAYFKDDFTKKMSTYLKDNKELAKKVKAGESGYDKIMHLEKIFKEYNENCK